MERSVAEFPCRIHKIFFYIKKQVVFGTQQIMKTKPLNGDSNLTQVLFKKQAEGNHYNG